MSLWYPYIQMRKMKMPYAVKEASGVLLHLKDGRTLIDAISSWWCVIHGYNHPRLNKALETQMKQFSHVMLGGLTHDNAEKLAAELVRLTPPGLSHVFFADSGSVGMEAALKMAVQYYMNRGIQGKTRFASLYRGYHGDTIGVMAVGDPEEGMHHLFKGYLAEHYFIHPPEGFDDRAGTARAVQDLEALFKKHHHEIAGFVCEPLMQGAGGFNFYPPEFLAEARRLCDDYGVLFILDEVATGFGRTGTMFACEQAQVVPDILVLAKALTAGYLGLSATIAHERVYKAFLGDSYETAFMHGPTFMGNALACAVALEGIRIFESENYLGKIARIHEILKRELPGFTAPGVREARVLGACGVIETLSEKDHAGIQEYAADRGVWLRPFLNVVYTMPPYIISEEELVKVCRVMKEFFTERKT
ncbi:MAG: adenosylmethionine--8-amino-7-oxononanoate transaminase [Fibrobacter sp.]|jgi:adenosylmethionine-8-amino-7-oxononanoate aminotransferase|nr:adenosylmethionine--8-amino-7-oxononanoate transaminase [Fibrobacter sp.]